MEDSAVDLGAQSPERPTEAKKVLSAKKLSQYKEKHDRRGIVYMSRVPPHLKPLKLRQMLEIHAKLGRIYMAPKDKSASKKPSKKADRGKEYSEAWVEFEDKKMGRAVAELLNGTPMGGKRRSKYHDDLWTLKYLPKFKWDHLTEEIAYQKAVREKRFAQELSASKKERDFYLSKVAESKKLAAISERKRKKGEGDGVPEPKRLRTFNQREAKPEAASSGGKQISKDVLSMFAR